MKLKPRKNQYGYMVVDCPFCDDFIYMRESRLHNPDRLSNLKRHITNQARNEALEAAISNVKEGKHLVYMKTHTEPKVIKIKNGRQFNNDLSL